MTPRVKAQHYCCFFRAVSVALSLPRMVVTLVSTYTLFLYACFCKGC
jgi:hypothetical protein